MRLTTVATVLMLVNLTACKGQTSAPPAPSAPPSPIEPAAPELVEAGMIAAFPALPAAFDSPTNPPSDDKIALGRMLYFDTRLSKNQDVSCNTCHDLASYGVDNLPVSRGHRGQTGTRNSPTVYNAAGHFVQFWDGRAADVEAQAKGPVTNPVEMAMVDEARVVVTLKSIPGYVAQFARAWPGDADPVTFQHMADAIGAFERKLVTPSRWDRFVGGDRAALTDDEQRGFVAFQSSGCVACHLGPTFGGQMFQKLGLVQAYPRNQDAGRFAVTGNEADRMYFKVPSLRNVERTSPYFHDGSIADLPTAVRTMARYQLGRTLPEQDVASIVTFLKALTGDLPADYIKRPELPPSSRLTPRPDPA